MKPGVDSKDRDFEFERRHDAGSAHAVEIRFEIGVDGRNDRVGFENRLRRRSNRPDDQRAPGRSATLDAIAEGGRHPFVIQGNQMTSGKSRWAILSMAAVSAAAAQTTGVVWESEFDQPLASSPQVFYSIPSDFEAPLSIRLTSAPNGDYYLHAPDWTGKATVSRLSAQNDAVVWRRIVSGSWLYTNGGRLDGRSMHDGGALVIAGGAARFSADGEFLWSRIANADMANGLARVHPMRNGDLLLASANPSGPDTTRFSRIDSSSGALVGGFALPPPQPLCHTALLETDPDDALYVRTMCLVSGQNATTVSRLASDHSVLWTRALPAGVTIYASENMRLVDGDALYLRVWGGGEPALMRLSASDGSQSWLKPGIWSDLRFDAGGDVLASFSSGATHHVELIDSTEGQTLWRYDMAARDVRIDAAADGIYLAGTDNDQTHGIVEKLDPDTGAPIWSQVLSGPVTGGYFRPGSVLAATAAIRVAGADCRPETECRIGVLRLDRATGAASPILYPVVPQNAGGHVVPDGDGHVLAYALEPAQVGQLTPVSPGQQIRVRRIDLSGTTVWERVFPLGAVLRLDEAHVRRTGDGDLLLWANTPRASAPQYGYPYVAKYSGSDGQLRWEKHLLSGAYPGGVDFKVDSDAAGNVFLGESSMTFHGSGVGYVRTRSLSRFGAGSGELQWTQPMRPSGPTLLGSAPDFRMVGNDVLSLESPEALTAGTIVRLSGATGAPVWSSTELATPGAELIASQADDGFMRDAGNGVTAFSLATGAVRWTYRYADPAANAGTVLSGVIGADGDLYAGGMRAGAAGWVARIDRASGTPVWVNHLDAPAGALRARAGVRDAAQGHVHVTQGRGGETFLIRLDQQTGAFVDGSLMSRSPLGDESIADDGASYVRRMSDGQILAGGAAYRPGEAQRPWVGRLAAPSAGVHGNLALALDVSPALAPPGVVRSLTLPISYTGDAAIAGALALIDLHPAATGHNDAFVADALACVTSGNGSCSAVATPSGIRLLLDLSPGATATLTAQLRAIDQGGVVSAKVYAPYGLFESDLLDNEASVGVSADPLFVDGFE